MIKPRTNEEAAQRLNARLVALFFSSTNVDIDARTKGSCGLIKETIDEQCRLAVEQATAWQPIETAPRDGTTMATPPDDYKCKYCRIAFAAIRSMESTIETFKEEYGYIEESKIHLIERGYL